MLEMECGSDMSGKILGDTGADIYGQRYLHTKIFNVFHLTRLTAKVAWILRSRNQGFVRVWRQGKVGNV